MTLRATALLALVFPGPHGLQTAQPPAPLKTGDKVLWIGNSYSDWFGPTPDCLKAELAASSPAVTITTKFVVKGMGMVKEYYTWPQPGARSATGSVTRSRTRGH